MTLRFSALLLALALTPSVLNAQMAVPPGAPPAAPSTPVTSTVTNMPLPRPPCTPDGALNFVCGLQSVEDLVLVPGERWVLGSSFRPIGLVYLIDAKNHTATPAPITFEKAAAPYDATECVPDLKITSSHGLALRKGANGVHTLYVVSHRPEAVQVFRVDARTETPSFTWIGCVVGVPDSSGNAISPLPDGGFAITKMHPADQSMLPPEKRGNGGIYDGDITGEVYTWHAGVGYKEIPNTKLSGPNGLEISPDGKYAFIADYGRDLISKVTMDGSKPPVITKMPLKIDNVRYARNGKLFATGQYITKANVRDISDWGVFMLDPETMAISPVQGLERVKGTSGFWNATTTLEAGNELWIGTFRGDRVIYTPIR